MTDRAFVIRSAQRGAKQTESRFEYRVWPRSPHPAVSLLHRFWPLTEAERRSDIYLVHPASDWFLTKLRGERWLEIKHRDSDVGTVQHWAMPVSTAFPLTAARLGGGLVPAWRFASSCRAVPPGTHPRGSSA